MAKLYFYYSAMNAGKSTTLLQSAHNYEERGMGTLLFTPHIDDRYATGMITSRIGLQKKAIAFDAHFDFYSNICQHIAQHPNTRCILIDEAQFMTKDQVYQLSDVVDNCKIPVLTYGIRTDFQTNLFPGSMHLLAIADELIEIKTICMCGRKAITNLRTNATGEAVTEGQQVEIGGNDKYIAMCRQCFKNSHKKSLSSQSVMC